jgi:hypothetical protein
MEMLELNPSCRSKYKLLSHYWAWGEKYMPIAWFTAVNAAMDKHKFRLKGRVFFMLDYINPYRWRKQQIDCGKFYIGHPVHYR